MESPTANASTAIHPDNPDNTTDSPSNPPPADITNLSSTAVGPPIVEKPNDEDHALRTNTPPLPDLSENPANNDDDQSNLESSPTAPKSPSAPLPPFDWTDLHTRFTTATAQHTATESSIRSDFTQLTRFFSVWAEGGAAREDERSAKRLATRMAHVQNTEEAVEEKRVHYVRVVDAFQAALNMLDATT